MRLLTNNPRKIAGLDGYGPEVVERVPIVMSPGEHNRRYLQTKHNKLSHLLEKTEINGQEGGVVNDANTERFRNPLPPPV